MNSRALSILMMSAALAGASGERLFAQATRPADGAIQLNVESFYAHDPANGVSVPDSATALEKLAHAMRMQRLGQWDTAASLLQEVLEKYADKVVPAKADDDGAIIQYTSVATAVEEQLSHWPEAGLRVYRNVYEAPAAAILEKAAPGDRNALNKVCALYFATESGKAAAMRLIDLDLEAGEFSAAAWMGERLLKWHPTLTNERPRVLYRTAYAEHMNGDDAAANAHLNELKQRYGDALGTIRGKDVNLADDLTEALQRPAETRHVGGEGYRMFGGDPARNGMPSASCNPGALLYSVAFAGTTDAMNPALARTLAQQELFASANGLNVGVIPVVDRGQLFFQDGTRVYAVGLDSGIALPGWAATYPGEQQGRYVLTPNPTLRRGQYTLTLSDDAVYAVMDPQDRSALMRGQTPAPTRLVCLDRDTGRVNWSLSPGDLPDRNNLRSLRFGASVVVAGNHLYVLARGGKSGSFEECHAICLDARTGEYRWSCYLAGDNSAVMSFGGEEMLGPELISHPAYAAGRVYAVTNTGALAGIDAYSGVIQWLTLYPRKPRMDPRAAMNLNFRARNRMMPAPGKPWTHDAVIVRDGKVFSLPADSPYLLVHDAGTGNEIKRIARKDIGESDCLLGVWGDWILCAADDRAWVVNWRTYDADRENHDASIPRSLALATIRGRAFATNDSIYVPTVEHLERLALSDDLAETGLIDVDRYPPHNQVWGKDEGPGSVVVAEDHVVIATANGVNVYTDLKAAEAKLDQAIAGKPGDPEPLVRYAELLFVAGRPKDALDKLDEAIALLGGAGSMRAGPQRDGIFNTAMTFARKLGATKTAAVKSATKPSPMDDIVKALFERAAAAASTPMQQVTYRMARATDADQRDDPATEAALLQEILGAPELRGIIVSADARGPLSAGEAARQSLADMLRRPGGVAAYAPFEREAAEQLEDAGNRSDPGRLIAIADAYPNSGSAGKSLMAAAELFEKEGHPRQAKETLRRMILDQRDLDDPQSIYEALARNYLKLDDLPNAAARLEQAAAIAPTDRLSAPLPLPDGGQLENVTYRDAATALSKLQAKIEPPAGPDFRIASTHAGQSVLTESPGSTIANIDALIAPRTGFQRFDRIVTFSSQNGLMIFAVGQTTPQAANKAVTKTPRACAWLGDRLLVWTDNSLSMLNGDSGKVIWSASLDVLAMPKVLHFIDSDDSALLPPSNRPNMPPNAAQFIQMRLRAAGVAIPPTLQAPARTDGAERMTGICPVKDQIIIGTSAGRIACLNAADGSMKWQTRPGDAAVERLLATEDFVVARQMDDAGQQIVALDTFNGKIVQRMNFDNPQTAPINLVLSPAGVLVYTLPDRICAMDLYTPGDSLRFSTSPRQASTGIPTYSGFFLPNQLVVSAGRILAVGDQGQFVHAYALKDGEPLRDRDAGSGQEVPTQLQTQSNNDYSVQLHARGSRVYVISAAGVKYHNLDNPADAWSGIISGQTLDDATAMVGRNHVIVVAREGEMPPMAAAPAQQVGGGGVAVMIAPGPVMIAPAGGGGGANGMAAPSTGALRLLTFSRAKLPDGRESGLLDGIVPLPNAAEGDVCQGVDDYEAGAGRLDELDQLVGCVRLEK